MKANLRTAVIATALMAFAVGGVAWAVQTTRDRTKYDCRVVVGYRTINRTKPPPIREAILECPHKEQMAAGKCETSWLFGMRCKE